VNRPHLMESDINRGSGGLGCRVGSPVAK
jgi:hypothetical protein